MQVFQTGKSKEWLTYADVGDGPPLHRLKANTSLRTLQEEFVLFTYAPLFLYGGLEHNPVQEWINLFDHQQVVFILQLDSPVVKLQPPGDSKLDSFLWAVYKDLWPRLAMHIGSIGLLDRANKRFTRVICQEIPVVDVAAISNVLTMSALPTVNIYTFGVDSTNGCVVFKPATSLLERPTLERIKPRSDTLKLGKLLFAEEKDPYGSANACTGTSTA